jgi:hypothetical protein
VSGIESRGTVDAIIDPYKYNPIETYGGYQNIPVGLRFLMLDDVNNSENRGGFNQLLDGNPADSSKDPYRGPQAWREPSNSDSSWANQDGTDPIIKANSIIEWNGLEWETIWDPETGVSGHVLQNIRTGIKYRWDGEQWLKAFEGEYGPGAWNFILA